MKKLMLILLLCANTVLLSQEIPYNFNLDTMDFQLLSDSISISNGEVWDENSSYPLTFDFVFKIADQTYSNINVMAGGIQFAGQGNKVLYVYNSPYGGALLRDRGDSVSQSPISYRIDEEGGNKILKVEWRNAGFRQTGPDPPDSSHFVTFQVWLIENENKILVNFGSNSTTPETYGPSGSVQGPYIKLVVDDISLAPFGPSENPSWEYEDCSVPCYNYVKGTPPENLVYLFSPKKVSSIDLTESGELTIYPTLVNDVIHVNSKGNNAFSYQLHSIMGEQVIKADDLTANDLQIDVSEFTSGIYLLRLFDRDGSVIYSGKVLKR